MHTVPRLASAAAMLVIAHTALAGHVTVQVTTKTGAPVEDTVVVLDPLDASPAPTQNTATVDQINKQFVPRVTVVRTGTSVTFPNSDHIRHQVYSFSPAKTFSLKLYAGSPHTNVVFDHKGLVVLGCNIHDQMIAFVAVVDTPYFAKTAASGVAAVELPAGRYRLRIWQASSVSPIPSREINVGGEAMTIPLSVDLDGALTHGIAWPE
jgi:plastocyanin